MCQCTMTFSDPSQPIRANCGSPIYRLGRAEVEQWVCYSVVGRVEQSVPVQLLLLDVTHSSWLIVI